MFHSLSSTASNHPSALRSSLVAANRSFPQTTVPHSTGRTALSLNQMTTLRQSFVEDILCCEATGIARLGVWRRKLDEFGIDRAVELLRDHNVTVSSLNWGGGFTGGKGLTFDEAVEDTRRAVYQATRLRAHALTIVSGPRAGHIESHASRLLMDGLAATVEIAAEHGITLALQPMAREYADEWTFLESLEESLHLVRSLNHPFLGLAVGTCHVWQQPRVLQLLESAAPFIATVQLSDWHHARCDCERRLPGEGEIPLSAMIDALQRGGYQGDYELDVWSSDLWRSDTDTWLRRSADEGRSLIFGTHSSVLG